MSEQEKYWGCTPVVTAHMEARMKASREYAKMVSNDDETPAQKADRAKDFQCGAMWEEGYSKKHGWHPASELPVIPEGKNWVKVVALVDFGDNTLRPRHEIYKDKGWSKKDMWTVKYWCYPPEEE